MLSMPLIPDAYTFRVPQQLVYGLLCSLSTAVQGLVTLVTTLTAQWRLDKISASQVKTDD
jgi:hypothetical protein